MDYLLQRLLKTFAFTAPSASPILVLAILGLWEMNFSYFTATAGMKIADFHAPQCALGIKMGHKNRSLFFGFFLLSFL